MHGDIYMDSSEILTFLATLSTKRTLQDLVPSLLRAVLKITGAERTIVTLYEMERFSVQAGLSSDGRDLNENDFPRSTTILRKVLLQQQPLYIPCLQGEQEFAQVASIQELDLRSAICIPLFSTGTKASESEILGLLYVDSSRTVQPLTGEHLQLMQTISNYLAALIENAKLFEELELKNAELQSKNREIGLLNKQLEERVDIQRDSLVEMEMLLAEIKPEAGPIYGLGNLIGKSMVMQELFRQLQKVVTTNATVLIAGESGSGKELVARFIHYNGARAEQPMVSINCSAFSDTLLESELFGHKKGAFTGANENKIGLFQLADGGTLFLDEVGDMSAEMQKKLLRVVEDGEVRLVGGRDVHHVDVRIIAATNKNLDELVQQKQFREDLYFRLNVIHLHLPALRERREDISLLIDFYNRKFSDELKRPFRNLPKELLQRYLHYDWPGNVRELMNELRRALVLEEEYSFRESPEEGYSNIVEDRLAGAEKNEILKALADAGGNRTRAAQLLGLSRRAFYAKLAKHKIQ